jgi:hypothetical protein
VEKLLNVPPWVLMNAIRARTLKAPPRDSAGFYEWFEDDVARARKAVRNYKPRPHRRRLATV